MLHKKGIPESPSSHEEATGLAGPKKRVVLFARILVIIGLAAIAILSLVPGDIQIRTGLPKEIEHFGAYFAVAFILTASRSTTRFAVVSVVLLSLFACGMEVLQAFVPGRHGTVLDAVASVAGAAGGAITVHLMNRSKGFGRTGAQTPPAEPRGSSRIG